MKIITDVNIIPSIIVEIAYSNSQSISKITLVNT
jgi:hypothetical protein